MEPKHERRVRYKGTHPRSFREKYKELDPEKYGAEIAKHLQKGKTPAGMHIPICVEEILAFLDIQPGQVGLDATLGYGGHSQRMLEALQGQGHLYATDVDPVESEKTRLRLEKAGYGAEIFTLRQMNFAQLDQVAPGGLFDFVLADLGVSSMQIDDPARGFTFREDGPLDLRLNQQAGVPAAQRLAGAVKLCQMPVEGPGRRVQHVPFKGRVKGRRRLFGRARDAHCAKQQRRNRFYTCKKH